MAVAACWAAEPTQATTGYRIGPKDLLEIKVFEVPELNIERRVGEDGSLNLPLIGEVPVQGLTDIEVADRLKAMLEAKYVQRASVTVQVRDFRSKPISVIGAVRGPGNLAFSGRWTLIEALTAAGGLTDQHSSTIYVLRRAENGLSDQIAIDSEELLVKANPDVNIPIVAGDLINVPGQVEVTVFCLGEIKTPGAVNFKSGDRITVLTTIARAGGLTERASRSLRIKRREASGKEVELKVDFKRILSGKDPDVALQNGDVIVIKESLL
jgi:polysaccharide export outer membrane protein